MPSGALLRPEHFDVAATEDEVNYGVSAGDGLHDTPYAYVGPWTPVPHRTRSGTLHRRSTRLELANDVDGLTSRIADFFQRGRSQLQSQTGARSDGILWRGVQRLPLKPSNPSGGFDLTTYWEQTAEA